MLKQLDRSADISAISAKYSELSPTLDERRRRLWAASEARSLGRGGIAIVQKATNLAANTIRSGIRELEQKDHLSSKTSVRRSGGGRKPIIETNPYLKDALDALVEPTTRGDPQSPLRWTCKSLRKLASELAFQGHPVCIAKVRDLLLEMNYSLQANQKTNEGSSHPDRDAQFKYINEQASLFMEREQPVISVDAKKKEQIGEFKNAGQEWQPKGAPIKVNDHDFPDPNLGHAIPYGVYDLANNKAWVSVGIDHNTAEFAVSTIISWWRQMGRHAYPNAKTLLITADCGGSNGRRSRLWKLGLQRIANATGLKITVCHFPPGTSKWNKIEHRLFSHITQNWRGQPLVSHEAVVNLIGSTTTRKGLSIQAALDTKEYPLGIQVTDDQLKAVKMKPADFHGEWNYTVSPSIIWY